MLDVGQNRIATFQCDLFVPLQNLSYLYLDRNYLGLNNLPKLSEPLVSLRVLDLSYNVIETVGMPFSGSFPSLQILNLENNHLGKSMFISDSGEPLFGGLTALERVSFSNNNIRNSPDLTFRDQVSLKVLNISINQISGWGQNVFKFSRKIAKLDISFNLIPVLTENNLHDLNIIKDLYLRGNPFICKYDLLWFREWIDRTSVGLPDKESYTCHGQEVWRGKIVLEFTKDKIKCTMIRAFVGAVSRAIFISAVFVILAYKHRWRLRLRLYLLFKRGRRFLTNVREHAHNNNYVTHQQLKQVYIDFQHFPVHRPLCSLSFEISKQILGNQKIS